MRKTVLFAVAVVLTLLLAAWGYRAYLISELRKPVLAKLNDPTSAQFQNEVYFGNWTVKGGNLCGQVNAKNRMGGYVGYHWFQSFDGGASIEDDELKEVFDEGKLDRCAVDKRGKPFWWLHF